MLYICTHHITNIHVHICCTSAAHLYASCHKHGRITSHTWCVCLSCHAYEWVVSHIEWVMSRIWLSHVTNQIGTVSVTNALMIEPCRTFERVMSHIWLGHVTHATRMASYDKGHTLQHTAAQSNVTLQRWVWRWNWGRRCKDPTSCSWSHCNALQLTATHCIPTSHPIRRTCDRGPHTSRGHFSIPWQPQRERPDDWVMSHTWMSHVTHVIESRHTYLRYVQGLVNNALTI